MARNVVKSSVAGVSLAMGLFAVAACGGADVSDVSDVDVDEDSTSIVIEDESGDTSMTSSTGGEIPDWLPDEMPLPESYTVDSSTVIDSDSGGYKALYLLTDDGFDDVVAVIDDGLAAAGIEPTMRSIQELSEGRLALFEFEMDGAAWVISVSEDANDDVVLQYGT